MSLQIAFKFFVAMVAVVNPAGKVPLWLDASEGCEPSVCRRLALLVTLTAFVVLAGCIFFGQAGLDALGLDLASFRIGGGIVILLIGIDMLHGSAVELRGESGEEGESPMDRAMQRFRDVVVPISIPILAGPGSITTTILYGSRAESWAERLVLGGVLLGIMALVLVLLLAGRRIRAYLGPVPLTVQTKLWGLVLAGLAAQLIVEGLGEVFPSWLDASSPLRDDMRENGS